MMNGRDKAARIFELVRVRYFLFHDKFTNMLSVKCRHVASNLIFFFHVYSRWYLRRGTTVHYFQVVIPWYYSYQLLACCGVVWQVDTGALRCGRSGKTLSVSSTTWVWTAWVAGFEHIICDYLFALFTLIYLNLRLTQLFFYLFQSSYHIIDKSTCDISRASNPEEEIVYLIFGHWLRASGRLSQWLPIWAGCFMDSMTMRVTTLKKYFGNEVGLQYWV